MTALVCAGGCKKNSKAQSSSSPAEPQTTTAETEEKNSTLDKNTAPTDRKLAPNAPDKEDSSPEKTDAKAVSQPTANGPEPAVAPAAKSKVKEKPLRTVCVRACNKAQICGKAAGSGAAECIQKCLNIGSTSADGESRVLESFRAQEACANTKCEDFDSCVQRDLARRRQLKPVPVYETEKASQTCKALCEHEQKCKPEIFVQLRKNMDICTRYCAAVLTGTDTASGTARTIMSEAIKCLGKSCDDFEACIN